MSRRGWFAVSLSLSPEFAAQSPLVSSPSLPRGGGVLVDGRTLTAAAARLVDEALQRHDADGDGALSPKELDAFNLSCGGGALEADDLVFLLDSFEVDAPSGGLTGRGFRQYFAHALGEDFDEARDDLRKALGREA